MKKQVISPPPSWSKVFYAQDWPTVARARNAIIEKLGNRFISATVICDTNLGVIELVTYKTLDGEQDVIAIASALEVAGGMRGKRFWTPEDEIKI